MRPKFLDDFVGEWRTSGEQRNYRVCPACKSTQWKTYVDPVSGKWICFSNACKAVGRVRTADAASSLRDRLFKRERGVPEFLPIDLPETLPLTEEVARTIRLRYKLQNPERYLLRIGTEELSGRVVIPYADRKGDFIFWNARSIDHDVFGPKYMAMQGKKPLYVPDYVYRNWCNADTIVLVEGPFDAMSLHNRCGYRAAALGGTSISDAQFAELKRLVTVDDAHKRVRILLDSAALSSAIALKHKLSGLLPEHDIQVRQLPAGVKDPAVASFEALNGLI